MPAASSHRPPARRPLRHRRRPRGRGFALVDVIIGGVMLAVGLAVVITMASRSMRSQVEGEKQLVASWLADELLSMVLVEGPDNFQYVQDMSGRFDAPFEVFSFDVDIEETGRGAPYRVNARVSWPGPGGRREVEVETLVARREGDPEQPREPYEPVDRDARYYEDELEAE